MLSISVDLIIHRLILHPFLWIFDIQDYKKELKILYISYQFYLLWLKISTRYLILCISITRYLANIGRDYDENSLNELEERGKKLDKMKYAIYFLTFILFFITILILLQKDISRLLVKEILMMVHMRWRKELRKWTKWSMNNFNSNLFTIEKIFRNIKWWKIPTATVSNSEIGKSIKMLKNEFRKKFFIEPVYNQFGLFLKPIRLSNN